MAFPNLLNNPKLQNFAQKKVQQIKNLPETTLQRCWKIFHKDVGNSLIHLGALGWLLSAAAQVNMIIFNKDIDAKEKEFLLPQETTDMVVNVGLYYTICQSIKKAGDSILEKGHFLTRDSFDTIMHMKQSSTSISDYLRAMNEVYVARNILKEPKFSERLSNFFDGTLNLLEELDYTNANPAEAKSIKAKIADYFEYNPILRETFSPVFKENRINDTKTAVKNAMEDYKNFKNGVGVFTAVLASVLACNIITPIARNYTANYFQKQSIKRDEKQKFMKLNAFTPIKSIPAVYSRFKV